MRSRKRPRKKTNRLSLLKYCCSQPRVTAHSQGIFPRFIMVDNTQITAAAAPTALGNCRRNSSRTNSQRQNEHTTWRLKSPNPANQTNTQAGCIGERVLIKGRVQHRASRSDLSSLILGRRQSLWPAKPSGTVDRQGRSRACLPGQGRPCKNTQPGQTMAS